MNPLVTTGLDRRHGATALSVNVNKVATLRNTRTLGIPSVSTAARRLDAGAHGITVHPRPDQRHIRADDVHDLAELLKSLAAGRVQHRGQPVPRIDASSCARCGPHAVHLVPDTPTQATSDHGWDLREDASGCAPLIGEAERARRARQPVHGPVPERDAGACARSAPTASSCTPSLCAAPRHAGQSGACSPASPTAARRRCARASASTPATTSTAQPDRLPARRARRRRGVDRPRADRRRARARLRRDGARYLRCIERAGAFR